MVVKLKINRFLLNFVIQPTRCYSKEGIQLGIPGGSQTNPVEGSTWTDEKSTRIGAFFVWSLEDVMKDVPYQVKDLFERSWVNLSKEQSIVLTLFLTEFADIFAKDDTDLGCFSTVQYRIDTGHSKPICQ